MLIPPPDRVVANVFNDLRHEGTRPLVIASWQEQRRIAERIIEELELAGYEITPRDPDALID